MNIDISMLERAHNKLDEVVSYEGNYHEVGGYFRRYPGILDNETNDAAVTYARSFASVRYGYDRESCLAVSAKTKQDLGIFHERFIYCLYFIHNSHVSISPYFLAQILETHEPA